LQCESLLNYMNRLPLVGAKGTTLNLAGPDLLPRFDRVFFVGPVDPTTKTEHLKAHFGSLLPNVTFRYKWRDDVSAFLETDADLHEDQRALLLAPHRQFPLSTFAEFAASPGRGLKRKSSEESGTAPEKKRARQEGKT